MKNVESMYNYLIYSVNIKHFLISCVYFQIQIEFLHKTDIKLSVNSIIYN